ncbi:MAG: type II toxin-antitoxin system PemK/MazF family toxin [Prosthecobacter sp.]|uniref:type II toxin-antitoxin system PemK/MazF family toxin n=1 Tax=Prosthecobacter sp. TaxID=1965333 RepID=UPI003903DDB1
MRQRINPGEVWIVDLGIAGKIRPALALTGEPADNELTLVSIVAHTTSLRDDNPWQVVVPKPFLRSGAFHLQQINSVPSARFERYLGRLTDSEFASIKARLGDRLGI